MPIVKGLRRFTSNIVSSRRAVTEISNLVPGSNVQRSGRSSAAPFTSKRPIRKRVTSDDRKAMLESFVDKYRATNLGKFPSPTSALKEVGGSYYLIRKMLQEMEYNSKFSSTEKGLVKENKKPTKGKDTVKSSRSKEASSGQIVDQQLYKDALPESISNFDTNFELKEGLQPSTGSADTENSNITRDDTCNVATENQDIRATNLGKFPSPTSAPKEVGFSYDAFRKSLQEMQYNSKFSSTEKGLVKENKKPTKGKDTVKSSRSKEASSGQIVDQQLYKDALPESISNFDTNFELKEGFQPSTGSADTENSNITRDDTCNVATENQDIRATNLGKFPSPTSAPKEVGFSYDAFRKSLQEMQYNSKFSSTEKGLVKENKKPTKGKDTVKSSRSKEASSGQIVDQQLYKDALPESISNFDTNFELKEGFQPSTGSADTENSNITRDDTCNVATENQDIRATNLGKFPSPTSAPKEVGFSFDAFRKSLQEMQYNSKFSSTEKGLVKENKKPTKGKDTVKSSRSKEASSGQIVDQQLYKDALPESISNFDTNFELKEGLQPSTGSADTENSNITRDYTCNVATENQDIRGLCCEKPEHNVRDESPSEDHFDFNDSGPKVEQQHDGIRNVMRDKPESRKDNELTEKPSIWVNLKAMATGFINIWKKH